MPVNVDDSWLGPPGLRNRKLEKFLRRNDVGGTARERSRWCCRPSPRLYTGTSTARQRGLGFIAAPRRVRNAHLGSNPLIQHAPVPKHPPSDCGVIDRQGTLGHHFFQVAIAERTEGTSARRGRCSRPGNDVHGTVPGGSHASASPYQTSVDPVCDTACDTTVPIAKVRA